MTLALKGSLSANPILMKSRIDLELEKKLTFFKGPVSIID